MMSDPIHDALFPRDPWEGALESYAHVTQLTVCVFDREGRQILGPIHPTPLFQFFHHAGYDPGLLSQTAHACLAQTDQRHAVHRQVHGLAAIGTSLMLDGEMVGVAVGGYIFADFLQTSHVHGLARLVGVSFERLWEVMRRQAPMPQRRLQVCAELLQVLGDTLLRENHRTRQYERAAAIIQGSDDAIISKTLDGIITSWNRGAERLFGYPAAEIVDRSITLLIPPERIEEERVILSRIHHGVSLEHYETVRRRKDGTLLDVSLSVSPIRDAQGRIVGASKVARDITARKQAEQALRGLNEKLESLVEERTHALVVSQDQLRILASQLNLAEQRERKRLAAELHDYLQQMLVLGKLKLGQGRRMGLSGGGDVLNQIDNMLTEALQYTRTLVADLSPPVLRDHGLSAGLSWLADHMREHDITITAIVPDTEDWELPEDQVLLLFQSVRELLINAAKHAGSHEATVTLERRGDHLHITVRDQGRGFDHHTDFAETNDVRSSRFGLFSIRERMRALGGRFEIDSTSDYGTNATLILPLADHAASDVSRAELTNHPMPRTSEHAAPRNQTAAVCENRIRVLLVDDHVMMRQGLRSVLDNYPDVELLGEAGDGLEALAMVEQLHPSVVVMDITMPKMNGIEATLHIKAHHPEIVVVGLSVNAGGENQEAMLNAGAVRLLTKEAAVDELYQAIQTAVYGGVP